MTWGSQAGSLSSFFPSLLVYRSLLIAVVLMAAVLLSAGYIIGLKTAHMQETIAQQNRELQQLNSEKIRLLAERARLMSREHIVAVAGKKLQLYPPEKKQIHHM
ncbi:MAG: hypothetical protein CSA32_00985 [Desulfobulbus propionicus]|nr:MAG: hypothetical protein CSA32_00985 [Desulfobulbus propionicus]